MTAADTLSPLPGRKGLFIGIRESLAYLRDPDHFIAERTKRYGPVFGTTLFFRPTAVVGGVQAVEHFLDQERAISESSLPAAFTALHTPYGALNQQGARHRSTRAGYAPLFTSSAFAGLLPLINQRITAFVGGVAHQGSTAIARDCKRLCLDLFAEIFAGDSLTAEEAEAFITYNDALLSLSTALPSFKRGEAALARLQSAMAQRLARFRSGALQGNAFAVFSTNRDETGQPWSDERIVTATVLLIWGAYVEVASLMSCSLILCQERPEVRERILSEAQRQGLNDPGLPGALEAWDLPYVQGVLRESLRLMPPGGGGFRLTSTEIAIAGFRIPAGTVVTADPRIGNRLASLFPQPDRFEPERWVAPTATRASTGSRCPVAGTALRLPRGAWFPGGTGSHGCPGLPLAELCGRIFLVRWMQAIKGWQPADGAGAVVPYSLIPIRIPTDDYRLGVEPVD